MINDIPNAKLYVLLPVAEPKEVVTVGDTRICGGEGSTLTFSQLLLNHMAMHMDEKDIIGITGINLERCMLVVRQSKSQCEALMALGLTSVHKALRTHSELIPEGGFEVKDWAEIPDNEKGGIKVTKL